MSFATEGFSAMMRVLVIINPVNEHVDSASSAARAHALGVQRLIIAEKSLIFWQLLAKCGQ